MALAYRSEAIAIGEENRGDSDRVISFFTRNSGRVEILGKSIRKITSKLRSGCHLFCLSDISYIKGRFQKTLTDAVLLADYTNLRHNPSKLKIAFRMSETLCQLIKNEERDEEVWEILLESLLMLEKEKNRSSLPIIYYYFFFNLIKILGFYPELDACTVCSRKKPLTPLKFSFSSGGIVCSQCRAGKAVPVDLEVVKVLKLITSRRKDVIFKIKPGQLHKDKLRIIASGWMLERALSSNRKRLNYS